MKRKETWVVICGGPPVFEIGVERPNGLARAQIFNCSFELDLVSGLWADRALVGDCWTMMRRGRGQDQLVRLDGGLGHVETAQLGVILSREK
jgi:hypothetical protein